MLKGTVCGGKTSSRNDLRGFRSRDTAFRVSRHTEEGRENKMDCGPAVRMRFHRASGATEKIFRQKFAVDSSFLSMIRRDLMNSLTSSIFSHTLHINAPRTIPSFK